MPSWWALTKSNSGWCSPRALARCAGSFSDNVEAQAIDRDPINVKDRAALAGVPPAHVNDSVPVVNRVLNQRRFALTLSGAIPMQPLLGNTLGHALSSALGQVQLILKALDPVAGNPEVAIPDIDVVGVKGGKTLICNGQSKPDDVDGARVDGVVQVNVLVG